MTRRGLLGSVAALAAVPSAPTLVQAQEESHPKASVLAYVGSYTPNGQDIYLMSLNLASGVLTQIKVASTIPSPSWIAIHPHGEYLYAVNEISNFNGGTHRLGHRFLDQPNNRRPDTVQCGQLPRGRSRAPQCRSFWTVRVRGQLRRRSIAVLPIHLDGSLGNATDVHVDVGSVGPLHATNASPGQLCH
jgi:6-phosphogluconolactonase